MERRLGKYLVMAALAAALVTPAHAAEGDWQWSVTPYFWLSNVGLDVSVNDQDVFQSKTYVNDIIDQLDFAMQVNVQAQRGRHGVLLDVSYFNFGDDDLRIPLSGPAGSVLVADGDLRETLLDVGGIYNPRGDGTGFALIYGIRMIDVDQTVDVRIDTPLGPTASRRYETGGTGFDGLVGVRYFGPISDRWLFNFKADVSTGDSELTWDGLVGVGYTFGDGGRYALLGGYRYMKIELNEKDQRAEVETRLEMYGPYMGMRFAF